MLLNSEELISLGIIELNGGKKAQVGIDLTLNRITAIQGGYVGIDKTDVESYKEVDTDDYGDGKEAWFLTPGIYSLTFDQGVNLKNIAVAPDKHGAHAFEAKLRQFTGFVVHRSSILRSGAQITSGVFDPGFQCDQLGATMIVHKNLRIEKGARVAQFIAYENNATLNTYSGNYQGDKDLK